MVITGQWVSGDDGVIRPIVHAIAIGSGDRPFDDRFLIDSGADRTVFSTSLLFRLGLPSTALPPDNAIVGIGGTTECALIRSVVEFTRADGGIARVRGEFVAFLNAAESEYSVLGRDILDHFDLILSRRRNEVLLLGLEHAYSVSSGQ